MSNSKTVNQARKAFQAKYGPRSLKVVSLLARGLDVSTVATRTGVAITSVRTYRANLSRNAYSPFVSVSKRGLTGSLVSATR